MNRISCQAQERHILGKKVKRLRRDGQIPGHVFGNQVDTEHVAVDAKTFLAVYHQAGETGLIDLKIGNDKVRPVLIRDLQLHPVTSQVLNIDFYQVNLKEKVTVYVPIVLVGQEPESVHMGETVVLQPLSEVQVEALPADLVDKIEVNIEVLKNIDDAILLSVLNYDREKITILADPEEVVVKLAPAVTEEMKQLIEEQEAEAVASQEAAQEAVGEEGTVEGDITESEAVEGEAVESADGGEEPAKKEFSEG